MNKKQLAIWVVALILTGLLTVLTAEAYKSGMITNSSKVKTEEYNSIDKLLSLTDMEIELPEFIKQEKHLKIEDKLGAIIQISNENFVLKIADFVDVMADPLALYESSGIDNRYNFESENTNIKFFRYRAEYKEYKNCTIVNWSTDNTTYGLMIGDKITEEDALSLIGLSREDLTKEKGASEITEVTAESPYESTEYQIYIK